MPDTTRSSFTNTEKMQIADWLREVDKLIRAARYLAADGFLQKIFNVDPDNELAVSYQDRIQFLIKQLSQRTGLSKDIEAEIRKYAELLRQRRLNQTSSLLVTAQRLLDRGDVNKAYADASKALVHRLTELQKRHSGSGQDPDNVFKFRSFVWDTWQKGRPSEIQLGTLQKVQRELRIEEEAAKQIEREVKNRLYREALNEVWQTGGISAFTVDKVEELRSAFGVARADHLVVESTLLREVRKNRVRGTVLVVEDNEKSLLELAQILRSNSFAVIAAANVEEGLATLETVSPDIVLSEINFQSGPAGFDLFEFIRATPATQQTPFLFMSSEVDRTTRIIGKRLGVDDFVLKPIDYELLIGTLTGQLLPRTGRTG
ncbi:MAG: response regulator [Ignavibacteria bacterium]|nr:MAG: response regulator [Ignavibacteria bacterium]